MGMRCEDFPCCGHESGCCPDYDESGKQINMKCTCGAVLPINNRSSICDSCLSRPEPGEYDDQEYDDRADEKDCPECDGCAEFSKSCGAYVCNDCEHHIGLARCYCGWSASGGNGRQELEEMGETIEPEDGGFFGDY